MADRRGALGVGPDQEAGFVDERHDRQVERVAQLDVAAQLLRGLGGHRAGVEARVVGYHADRLAAQARELEEAVAVERALEHAPHLVALAPIARHELEHAAFVVGGVVDDAAPQVHARAAQLLLGRLHAARAPPTPGPRPVPARCRAP